jgi:phosphatidylglycerophosphate synthase
VTAGVRELLPSAVSAVRPLAGLLILTTLPARSDSLVVLPIVLAASATDWLDGELARRTSASTKTGRVIDNLCDFAFLAMLFAFFAQAELWTPPVWGRLARQLHGANWLPFFAILASFGVYFVRLGIDLVRGREPERSPRGHQAGIANYVLVIMGAVEMVPGVNLGPWVLEPTMVTVALLNVLAVPENVLLLFHRRGRAPTMPE